MELSNAPRFSLLCTDDQPRETLLAKEEEIKVEGTVTERLPNARYRVELKGGHKVLAYLAGKIRWQTARIMEGSVVGMLLSPYDLTQGRIVYVIRG